MSKSEPDWLIAWRKEREARPIPDVPLATEPFGVVRLSPIELASWAVENGPVIFILYRGTFLSRDAFHIWMRSMEGYDGFTYAHVNEIDAVGLLSADLGSDAVDAWPMMRHLAGSAVRSGHSVVIEAAKYGDLKSKVRDLFTTGPRAVVVVDPSATYEDEGGEDGVTGVIWTDRWERPRRDDEF
jgi:hypothetical protein